MLLLIKGWDDEKKTCNFFCVIDMFYVPRWSVDTLSNETDSG